MRIGELARRTGTTTRQLRYYEEQGLLDAARSSSNYRDYEDAAVERVTHITSLVGSGMPTRVVKDLLPRLHGPNAKMQPHTDPVLAEKLRVEHARLEHEIQQLLIARDRVDCYLDRLR